MPSLRDLMERRVPHYLAVYLGAGWGLIEFVSFLEERYHLAAAWTDLLLLAWALFIPSVLLFTWHHGRPGRDRWVRSEKVFIPLNAVLVLVVLGTAFSGRASATTTVTLTDETGATIERTVARSEFRKRLAVFDFTVPAADTALAWLGTAMPSLIASDLSQDIFLDLRVTAHFRKQLREAGLVPGAAPPPALQRRIADELHLPYFIAGAVAREGSEILVTVTIHDASTGDVVGERTARGTDVLAMTDELTPLLKRDLGLPRTQPGVVRDLPVAELLSHSLDAVRALTEGQAALLRDDWATAERQLVRAVELDPTFAFAHFGVYQVRALRGDVHGALPSLEAAMNTLYRVPERMQFLVKVEHFMVQREMDKAYAVATMMTELYPDDLQGYEVRLQLEGFRNDSDAAIATLRRMLELDPQQHERLLQLGALQESQGAYEDALRTYAGYATRFPQHADVQLRIASAQQSLGRLDAARAALERALLLEPTSSEVLVELAALARNRGEFDEAWRRLEAAQSAARTAQDRARVFAGMQAYHEFRGELRSAIAAGNRRFAAAAEYMPPVAVLGQSMSLLGLYPRAGQLAEGEAALARIRAAMSSQLADYWRVGQLLIAFETRDTVQLREAMGVVRQIITDFALHGLETEMTKADAVLAEVRGDWAAALRAYERQQQIEPSTHAINRDIARALRQLGRLDDALRAVDAHLRTTPAAPLTNLEAARIHLQRGDAARAREHLQRTARAWEHADAGYAPAEELKRLLAETGP